MESIISLFDAEIVDCLVSKGSWQASPCVELSHWRSLTPFRSMPDADALMSMANMARLSSDYLFARLKEHSFADERSKDAGLTIAGFYYLTIDRRDGSVDGRYYDPASSAYQRVQLRQSSVRRSFAAVQPL